MASSRSSIVLLLAVSLVWGSEWIANGMLPDAGAPRRMTLLRYLAAAILTGLAWGLQVLARRPRHSPPALPHPNPHPAHPSAPTFRILWALDLPEAASRAWILPNIILGLTIFAIPDLLLIESAQHGAAACTPLLYAALPLGLLLAAGELHIAAILGLGAMLVLLNGSLSYSAAKLAWALPIAAAVALQGWSLLHARRHLAAVSSLRGLTLQYTTAFWILDLSLQLWPESTGAMPLNNWPASALWALCLLAGLATAAAYPFYYRLLTRLEPAQLAVSTWLQTLVGVAESAWLLRRWPDWMMLSASIALVACAVSLLRSDAAREPNTRITLFPQ